MWPTWGTIHNRNHCLITFSTRIIIIIVVFFLMLNIIILIILIMTLSLLWPGTSGPWTTRPVGRASSRRSRDASPAGA
jgi:hypothetical protein